HHCETPRIAAQELKRLQESGTKLVILDSRPYEEYHRMNIPGDIDVPGAKVAYRVHDLAPDPATLVVVNCAGRTRSIIGCQSLRNAGIPNRDGPPNSSACAMRDSCSRTRRACAE